MVVNSYWVLLIGFALQVSDAYAEDKLSPIVERKKGGGAKIVLASDSNIFFQGLNEVNGGNTTATEKSCLVAVQDAQEGWSFRLAVLDTPAKVQMVLDAYKNKVMNGISIIGAKAVAPRTGTIPDPQNFFWSTGTPVDKTLWGKSGYKTDEPDNLSKHEDYVDIDENAQLHDIDESQKFKPLCEYYKPTMVERKENGGAKVILASDNNIFFQGLNEVNGGNTTVTEKSCLVAAQDAQEGWSFRLAVLDTPAKIQMVVDAYKNKVMNGISIIGAKAVDPRTGTIPDPQNFFWSTGTPVDKALWGKSGYKTDEPDNLSKHEDYVDIDENAQLHDIDESQKFKPLCEYYKQAIVERKKGGGAKIISATDSNIFFQGLNEVSGGKATDAEKSCLVAAQDAQEGWSFRLAVLDTPAKIQMVLDAYKNKVMNGVSIIGAKAVAPRTGTIPDPQNFFWSTGTPVDKALWGKSGYKTDEPDNLSKHEDYVDIDENAQLHDIDESQKFKPLCEYYKQAIVERKKGGGAKVTLASDNNIFFQGLNEVSGGNTADTEKSCLVAAQDAQEGWSFRLAVLDTPAKIQMVFDAYKNKVMNGVSIIGAKAVDPRTGTIPDPQNFFWSTGTLVDKALWGKSGYKTDEPDNLSKHEDYVDIDENAQLHDIDESQKFKPLCEYYKLTIVERKKGGGAKIISATDSNFFFQGLNEVSGGKTADAKKSCLVAAQDAQEGWSFRIAVLDTPAKIQMVLDAYKAKVLISGSLIGAKTVVPRTGAIPDPQNFFWSTGTPVDKTLWGKSGYGTQEPNNYQNREEYVYIDMKAQLHDISDSARDKPLCEYYRT